MHTPPMGFWGISAETKPLLGGHRNRAVCTVGLRRNLVFKTTRRSVKAMDWLVEVQQIAILSGFDVPMLLPSRNGRIVESGWTCEPFIEGRAFSQSELPTIQDKILRFHGLSGHINQRPSFLSASDLVEKQRGGDIDLKEMPASLVEMCRSAWTALRDGPKTIVHGDLNTGNLIRCDNGGVALIDWDECRLDSPIFDLGQIAEVSSLEKMAILAWEAACSWKLEPRHAETVAKKMGWKAPRSTG